MLLLSILLAASPAETNAAGMKLYQAKKYPEAIAEFRKAIDTYEKGEDPPSMRERILLARTIALARFNLACTLALLRKAGKVCEFDAYRSAITMEVDQSIGLDPNRLEKAVTDPDLTGIRDTLAFQSWLGLSPARERDLPKLLAAVKWWNRGVGVYGSTIDLSFASSGAVTVTMMVFDAEGVPQPKRKSIAGKWTLTGRTLRLTFPPGLPELKTSTLEGTFDAGGDLQFKEWGPFGDQPSECDA